MSNCPNCLEDLARPTTCENVVSGMVPEFLVGLKDDVGSWPEKMTPETRTALSDHIQTTENSLLEMKSGKRMFKISAKKGSAELKYELQGESGAKSFKAILECNIPGFRTKLLGLLSATANSELVILCKTRNGEIHLLGDKNEGVEYDSGTANTGKLGTDPNGADVVLSTVCSAPTVYMGGNWDELCTIVEPGG